MSDNAEMRDDLQHRINVLEDNLRDIVEQAAAYSGAEDEDRNASRIGDLEQEIASLKAQRDALA